MDPVIIFPKTCTLCGREVILAKIYSQYFLCFLETYSTRIFSFPKINIIQLMRNV